MGDQRCPMSRLFPGTGFPPSWLRPTVPSEGSSVHRLKFAASWGQDWSFRPCWPRLHNQLAGLTGTSHHSFVSATWSFVLPLGLAPLELPSIRIFHSQLGRLHTMLFPVLV